MYIHVLSAIKIWYLFMVSSVIYKKWGEAHAVEIQLNEMLLVGHQVLKS